jgi:hypothetical protein
MDASKKREAGMLRGIVLIVALSFALSCASCGGAGHVETPTVGPAPSDATAANFPEDEHEWGKFHSKRFAMSVPLPDARAWKVNDHTRPELVGTHDKTRSSLVVYRFDGPELMNRQRCEDKARELGYVPTGELHAVDDEVTVGPEAYDTRVLVEIHVGKNERAPITGHVLAFGAYIRKCLFVHFSSEVLSAKDESVLSARLATFRTRVLDRITLDSFDDVPREKER